MPPDELKVISMETSILKASSEGCVPITAVSRIPPRVFQSGIYRTPEDGSEPLPSSRASAEALLAKSGRIL